MTTSRSGRLGALDVHNCAERKVWDCLPPEKGVSVSVLSNRVGFTPQYTRKVLAHLADAKLASIQLPEPVALWVRVGSLGMVLRMVKLRAEPTGARSRRALCLRVWRLLHQGGLALDAESITKSLKEQSTDVYTALRTLKGCGLIRFHRTKSKGEKSTWESVGTISNARITITQKPAYTAVDRNGRDKNERVRSGPLINSIWALGTAMQASYAAA